MKLLWIIVTLFTLAIGALLILNMSEGTFGKDLPTREYIEFGIGVVVFSAIISLIFHPSRTKNW